MHRFRNKKDLISVVQTLGKSLLVDIVASLHPCQIVRLLPLVVLELFDVGLENTTALVHFLASFFSELVTHGFEIALQVQESILFLLQNNSLFFDFFSQLPQCLNLDSFVFDLFEAHVSNPFHELPDFGLVLLYLLFGFLIGVSVDDKLSHAFGKGIYRKGLMSLAEGTLLTKSDAGILLSLCESDKLPHLQSIAQFC